MPTVVPGPPEAEKTPQLPVDLARLLDDWSRLPEAVKVGILTMVNAASPPPG